MFRNQYSSCLEWLEEKLLNYEELASLSDKEFQRFTLASLLLIAHYLRAEEEK